MRIEHNFFFSNLLFLWFFAELFLFLHIFLQFYFSVFLLLYPFLSTVVFITIIFFSFCCFNVFLLLLCLPLFFSPLSSRSSLLSSSFLFSSLFFFLSLPECFDMRMERTALYAIDNGFRYFTTTNATSRWKDVKQVNESGIRGACAFNNVNNLFSCLLFNFILFNSNNFVCSVIFSLYFYYIIRDTLRQIWYFTFCLLQST